MKKALAVLLATVMLLSVCAVSVCADSVVTEHDFSTNQPGQMFDYYVTGEITVEGWADPEFNMGKNIFYGVTIINDMTYEITCDGYIQSVATFSDETFDVDHCSYPVTIKSGYSGDVSQIHFLP